MRILITDRHTSGDENIEQNAIGPDIELEFLTIMMMLPTKPGLGRMELLPIEEQPP